jgi:hypothetical protein
MAWKQIPGNPNWQFNDDPPVNNRWANMTFVGGVRTDGVNQVFAQVRRAGDPDDADRGEISATYWNAKVGVYGVQSPSYYSSLPTVGGDDVLPDNRFIPLGSDVLITSNGNFFLVSS